MLADPDPGADSLTREELLEAWRSARRDISRIEAGLAARSRELDLLQALGRSAAEAARASDLFDATALVLHDALPFDLILVGHPEEAGVRLVAHASRPVAADCLGELAREVAKLLGWAAPGPAPEVVETPGFDRARGERTGVLQEEKLALPIVRQGRPAACLLAVSCGVAGEAALRGLYGASNQLSLHLDRILTVRELEADRFRAILDHMPQGVLLCDPRLGLLQANASARRMLTSADLADGDVARLVERLQIAPAIARVVRGAAEMSEHESRLEDERVWSVTVSPVRDGRGRASGLVLVLDDVSERRRLRDQLVQAEKLSSLGRLLAGVAHELNNPLASIVGYAQLLAAPGADPALAERLGILRREAERCRRIVEKLLSFARQREPAVQTLSLNDVVRGAVRLLEYSLRVEGIVLETALDPELPAVRGDAHQLEQVLVNLMTNARHAIRSTGSAGTLRVRTVRCGEAALVEVADDGPGVPAAMRARIFDPFFTTKPDGEGTGLGLSLVWEIVTAHGGTVECVPAPAGGTIFRVSLTTDRTAPADAATAPLAAGSPVRWGKILVVDDESTLSRLMCEALGQDGHSTRSAADGGQALAELERQSFDLVICDLHMPGMDGPAFGRELARRAPELRRRMIWTTGAEPGAAAPEGQVLRKPFDLDELRRLVRERLAPLQA